LARKCAKKKCSRRNEPAHQLPPALALSSLIHALLLTTVSVVVPQRVDLAPTRLMAVINVSPRPTPPGAVLPAVAPVAAAPPLQQAPPRRTPGQRTRAPEAAPESLAPALARPPAEGSPPPETAPAAAPVVEREGISPDALRQYRMTLAVAARRFKRYPSLARERGWEGRVEVAVSIRAWHRPRISLVHSSGHALLDEQALSMIEQASMATTLPEALQGIDFRLLLPIEFTLDDES
jgi:protein TonB